MGKEKAVNFPGYYNEPSQLMIELLNQSSRLHIELNPCFDSFGCRERLPTLSHIGFLINAFIVADYYRLEVSVANWFA